MNYITIYILIAISFSIMFTINYSLEVTKSVRDALIIMDIDKKDFNWNPTIYLIASFIISIIFMPIVMPKIFISDKFKVIKFLTKKILVRTIKN